jgi:hypothetical protein
MRTVELWDVWYMNEHLFACVLDMKLDQENVLYAKYKSCFI